MSNRSGFTPADFDGIFFSEDSGSEAIFAERGNFISYIKDRPDGLFMGLAAHVDLRIYGKDPALTDDLLVRTQAAWPDADWNGEIAQALSSIDMLRTQKPHGWRRTIFQLVEHAALPPAYIIPENFQPYFWEKPAYELLFAMRAASFNVFRTQDIDLSGAVLLLVGLYLNGATDLVAELEPALSHFWDDVDLDKIRQYYEAAAEARATGSPTWQVSTQAAIQLAFRGFAEAGGALIISAGPPPLTHTPPDFVGIFMQRSGVTESIFGRQEGVVDLFTGRPEAGFVLAATVIDLRINGYGDLAERILSRAREIWTGYDFTTVDSVLARAAELAAAQPEDWRETIHNMAHDELSPKVEQLPEAYQSYFVPRQILELLYAMGIDGLGMMRQSGVEYYRVVKTLVVMNLNDDHARVATLEAVLPQLYPEANIAQLHELYADIRRIKEAYGEHWFTFANAHIEMTIKGHADIKWVEGAA